MSSPPKISGMTTDAAKATKPTRPLTAYHLLFQLEREYIIQTTPGKKTEDDTRPIGKQIDEEMPFRYRYIHLSPTWYKSGSGKRTNNGGGQVKRKHRKTHGKIGFLDLSKRIATRWSELKEVDQMTKLYVHKIAARELDIYKQELKAFKSSTASATAAVGTDIHRIASPSEITSMKIESTDESNTTESKTLLNPYKKSQRTNIDEAYSSSQQKETSFNVFGSESFSFHPVPSSYWKKYKKSSKVKGSRHASSSNKMMPQAPYSKHNMAQHQHPFTATSSYKSDMQGGINFEMCDPCDYQSTRTDLEKDIDSFMSQIEQDQEYGIHSKGPTPMNEPTMISPSIGHSDKVEITSDDALGLMEALSGGDNNE